MVQILVSLVVKFLVLKTNLVLHLSRISSTRPSSLIPCQTLTWEVHANTHIAAWASNLENPEQYLGTNYLSSLWILTCQRGKLTLGLQTVSTTTQTHSKLLSRGFSFGFTELLMETTSFHFSHVLVETKQGQNHFIRTTFAVSQSSSWTCPTYIFRCKQRLYFLV